MLPVLFSTTLAAATQMSRDTGGHLMNRDRRTFLATGLAAACIAGAVSPAVAEESALVDGLTCLDYGRSFICNTAKFNSVRFWVESRTVLIDGDARTEFYQCGSCK